MTPEEISSPLPLDELIDAEAGNDAGPWPVAEAIAEMIAMMVERNAGTITKAQALARKRHAGLAIYYHLDGHVECLVTHTVATSETEHWYVGATEQPLRVEIDDDDRA